MDHMEAEESHYSQVIPSFAVVMHYFTLLHLIHAVVALLVCICNGFAVVVAGTNCVALSHTI
jgi:hypothetical protein